ncbi:unnamed protein product [Phytophthora fragariaefolia]|uniref:Unnamed protein product n=1 Tax=Phytophthora fragariaefolia TaxID=1490495 RepID=A0A9W6U2K1_9STRA|nr:unnamed protein product [Phytophthora fragariaefolia]
MFTRSICRYVAWLYNNKKNFLIDSYLAALHEDDLEQDEAGIMSLKRTSVSRFIADHPNGSPINYHLHRAQDFEEFLWSNCFVDDICISRLPPNMEPPESANLFSSDPSDGPDTDTRNLSLTNARLTRAPSNFNILSMPVSCAWGHLCCGYPSGRIVMMKMQTKIPRSC